MNFSDHELMMLEQLTYLEDVTQFGIEAAPEMVPGETIRKRLSYFNEDMLKQMEAHGQEGQQWAAIIRYIKDDEDMCDLVQGEIFYGPENKVDKLGVAYHYQGKENEGLVTFRGTTTARDWHDNGVGLGTSDTPVQKEALAYIEDLDYENITVVGHSKGGNLAQYTTILSDKVNRCVSMDGQGFSGEFLEAYADKIEQKGHLVTNYSLASDFVHILLNEMPNSTQKYCAGCRVDDVTQNHFANSFFQYYTVDGTNYTALKWDDDGPVVIDNCPENPMMTYLHEFTCYVLNTMPIGERVDMGDYVGNILQLAMEDVKVGEYSDALSYAMSNKEQLGKIIAYLLEFMETNALSKEELRGLAEMLGLSTLLGDLLSVVDLSLIKDELTDGESDPFIEWALELVNPELKEIWQSVEHAYGEIPTNRPHGGGGASFDQGGFWSAVKRIFGGSKSGAFITRDFSEQAKQKLLGLVDQVENEKWCDFTDWVGDRWYDFEDWIGALDIRHYINNVNAYHKKVIDKNNASAETITKIFDAVWALDGSYATTLDHIETNLNQWLRYMNTLSSFVEPGRGRFNGEYMAGAMNQVMQDISDANVQRVKDRFVREENGKPVYEKDLILEYLNKDPSELTEEEMLALSEILRGMQDPENLQIFMATGQEEEPTGLEKFMSKAKPYLIHSALNLVCPVFNLQYITSGVIYGNFPTVNDPSREAKADFNIEGPNAEVDGLAVDAWLGKAKGEFQNEWVYGDASVSVGNFWAGADGSIAGMDIGAKVEEDKDGKVYSKEWERYAQVKAKVGASVSLFSQSAKVGVGSDMFGAEVSENISIGNAEAIAEGRASLNSSGGLELYGKVSAMVSAAKGTISKTYNILGTKVKVNVSGLAGAYGVLAEGSFKNGTFKGEVGAAKLFGLTVGVEVGLNDTGWANFVDYLTFWD